MDLTTNIDFQVQGAVVELQNENGIHTLDLNADHVYSGILYQDGIKIKGSWARIVISNEDTLDMEGAISTLTNLGRGPSTTMYYIKSIEDYKKSQRFGDVEIASPLSRPPSLFKSHLILLSEEDEKSAFGLCSDKNKCENDPLQILVKRQDEFTNCGTFASKERINKHLLSIGLPSLVLDTKAKVALGCPANQKLLLMGVAADCTYVQEKGGRVKALNSILANWNIVSAVYLKSFNVQLGVAKVFIQESCTPNDPVLTWNRDCSNAEYTISNRLSDFSKWRGNQNDNFGLWHLMTKCNTLPAVGIAWLGTLCQNKVLEQDGNSVSGAGVSSIVAVEWKVIAHEIGHNFGAVHDCTASTCDSTCSKCSPSCDCKSQFLMNPLDTSITDSFSPASQSLICSTITAQGSCLLNPGAATLITTGICGNGVKESGEDCDCGLPQDCTADPCCDASTCKFKPNAVCSVTNDLCCSQSCQFLPSTTVCHNPSTVCDTQAFCPGKAGGCPLNTFVPNGTACITDAGEPAECSSGLCTTRDLQCKQNGNNLNQLVSACPALGNTCQLSCEDTSGTCYQLTGSFVDGTTCGGIGRCDRGECSGATIFSMGKLLLDTYPIYGYPILFLGILMILSTVYGCVKACCCPKPAAPRQQGSRAVQQGPRIVRQSFGHQQPNRGRDDESGSYRGPINMNRSPINRNRSPLI